MWLQAVADAQSLIRGVVPSLFASDDDSWQPDRSFAQSDCSSGNLMPSAVSVSSEGDV